MFLVILLYSLFGFTFTLGKVTLFYARPFFIIASRMLIGGGGLLAYFYLNKHIRCSPRMKDWPYYTQVALFGIFRPYSLRAGHHICHPQKQHLFSLLCLFSRHFLPIYCTKKN